MPDHVPELGVDLQSFGQHLGSHVPHGIPADVNFGQGGVASQGINDDSDLSLEFGVRKGQGLQRLWREQQAACTQAYQNSEHS